MFDWVLNMPLEPIISLEVGSCISLHYIKSELSVYIISIVHLRQSKNNKAIHIFHYPIATYSYNLGHTPESNHEIYYDLIGNELGEYASGYASIDQLQEQLRSQVREQLLCKFVKIPKKNSQCFVL